MSNTFTIRPAVPADDDAVGRITVEAYINGGHLEGDLEYADELAKAALRRAEAHLLVAVDDAGAVLGSITICLAGTTLAEYAVEGEAEVRMLAVADNAAGRGVGAALMEAGIVKARELGAHTLSLHTLTSMTIAHRLYQRLGFIRVPHRDAWIEERIFLLGYELPL